MVIVIQRDGEEPLQLLLTISATAEKVAGEEEGALSNFHHFTHSEHNTRIILARH